MPYLLQQQEMNTFKFLTTALHHLTITLLVCIVLASSILFSIDIRFCGHKTVCNDMFNITRHSDLPSTTQHYDKVTKISYIT
jgi:hypothetical protein